MAEYIEREAAIKRLERLFELQASTARKLINSVPAADVVARDCYDRLLAENDRLRKERPVVHGQWKVLLQRTDDSDYECSACGGLILDVPNDGEHHLCSYCPNCGARMDGDA